MDTVRAVAGRIAEHAAEHRLPRVTVVLHGGEPLLLGADQLRAVLTILDGIVAPVTRLDLRMQSNGLLLSKAICDVLVAFDLRLGISLDGDRAANDRHRRFADGRSSYEGVRRALALLRWPEYRRQYAGILCTIDVHNDPIDVYEALLAESPPRIDLLLPHATWDSPPDRPEGVAAPYASWLLAIYDRWIADGAPVGIRLFDSLRSTAAGGPSGSEWVGLEPADLVVIETDGSFEQVDSLKTAYDGAPRTGLTVFTDSVDQVAALPEIARRQLGLADLAPQCRECQVVNQCGGGLFAHRYRGANGFDNPSVYCADLLELILSMNSRSRAGQVAVTSTAANAQAAPSQEAPAPSQEAQAPTRLVELIGSGQADASAVAYLIDTQLSISRAFVVAVAEQGTALARAGLSVLGSLERAAPQAARDVLRHPYVRVWAVDALKQVGVGRDNASSYLGCIAAAVAVRCGQSLQVQVPVRSGVIHLPTVGSVSMPDLSTGLAELTVTGDGAITLRSGSGDRLELGSPGGDQPNWQAARWLDAGGWPVVLEDLDFYRDCHDWKADIRLTLDRVADWQDLMIRAWPIVQADAPAQVAALRLGLRAITPLSADPGGLLRSSTARHAFGAVGAAPASPAALAVMLVHEFQHSMLGALLDLHELFDRDYYRHLKVAWRSDARPIEGVLQGTFAHLAVADMWRHRASRSDDAAAQTYRQYRDWTAAAIDTLACSGGLTPSGQAFVAGMGTTVASWSE